MADSKSMYPGTNKFDLITPLLRIYKLIYLMVGIGIILALIFLNVLISNLHCNVLILKGEIRCWSWSLSKHPHPLKQLLISFTVALSFCLLLQKVTSVSWKYHQSSLTRNESQETPLTGDTAYRRHSLTGDTHLQQQHKLKMAAGSAQLSKWKE